MSMIVPELEELVRANHPYRAYLKVIDFEKLTKPLESLYSNLGRGIYPVSTGFKCLFMQFLNDLSDRQMEDSLRDNIALKYFCGFGLTDQTPDHSYFGALRKKIGTSRLSKLFTRVNKSLKKSGAIREVFSFIDASALNAQVDHWKARDKAVEDKSNVERNDDDNPTMNNQNASNYLSDKDARFGCKGKSKMWVGYKRHVSVDMSNGLINKIAITPANVTDSKGSALIMPNGGMVFGDKAYCEKPAQDAMKKKGCHSAAILKNNMKNKNKQKDKWLTVVRMPFEGTFSKMRKTCRYRGVVKTQFQATFEALVFNIKRLTKIKAPPIILIALEA